MNRKTLLPALIVMVSATGVHAQGLTFEGATVSVQRADNRTFDYYQNQYEGSVELGFGTGFSVQADLAKWFYEGGSGDDNHALGLHLIYDVGASTSAGAFFTYENWDGQKWNFAGIEARHTFDGASGRPLTVEGFYGYYTFEDSGFYTLDVFGVDADWSVGSGVSLTGGVTLVSGDEDVTMARIGAEYALEQGPRIGLEYASQDFGSFDQDILSLTLAFDLKGGVTFQQRKWVDVFPSY